MKFGKLENISNVNFSLPPEPRNNTYIFKNLKKGKTKLHIGCTGWSMPEWKGIYYPHKASAKSFLQHYSKQFNTIEFNTTHYNIPKRETVKRWKEESADDFIFCPKVFKFISHTKKLGTDGDRIFRMIDNLSFFEEKLGPMFMQLPPYFGIDRLDVLETFLKEWPEQIKLSIELRNESWYKRVDLIDNLQDLIVSYGQILLITDVAGRRDIMHMRICNDYLMVRWVGNGLHETDYTRIDEWVQKISYYAENGIKDVYFFTHEPDNILAPDIASYLCSKVLELKTIETRGPKQLNSESQLKLF